MDLIRIRGFSVAINFTPLSIFWICVLNQQNTEGVFQLNDKNCREGNVFEGKKVHSTHYLKPNATSTFFYEIIKKYLIIIS